MKRALILIFVLFGIFWTYQLTVPNPSYPEQTSFNTIYPSITPYPSIDAEKLLNLINDWKIKQGSQPYTEIKNLCDLTEIRLKEIKTNFSHDGFWKHKDDYVWKNLSENLSENYSTEQETFTGWLNSSSHSAILKSDRTYSCLRCEDNKCVQLFANM